MLRLAILVSGGGSNMQAILKAHGQGRLQQLQPALVIADRPCPALKLAAEAGLHTCLLEKKVYREGHSRAVDSCLQEHEIDLAALAGYLSILSGELTRRWAGRLVNIHPSLLPRFGGSGFYGLRVHQAVLDARERVSGCTVHMVDDGVDTGRILAQVQVPVHSGDDASSLAARILVEEHRLYPEVLSRLAGKLQARS